MGVQKPGTPSWPVHPTPNPANLVRSGCKPWWLTVVSSIGSGFSDRDGRPTGPATNLLSPAVSVSEAAWIIGSGTVPGVVDCIEWGTWAPRQRLHGYAAGIPPVRDGYVVGKHTALRGGTSEAGFRLEAVMWRGFFHGCPGIQPGDSCLQHRYFMPGCQAWRSLLGPATKGECAV